MSFPSLMFRRCHANWPAKWNLTENGREVECAVNRLTKIAYKPIDIIETMIGAYAFCVGKAWRVTTE